MSAFKIESFVDGDVIFKIGDPANNLYILSDGQVDLLDDHGVVFDQIHKGEPFGEAAFLNGGFRSATVRAKGNVVCKKIKNGAAVKMLNSFSPLLVWFFINFTVIFLSILENPVFHNFRIRHERHSAV